MACLMMSNWQCTAAASDWLPIKAVTTHSLSMVILVMCASNKMWHSGLVISVMSYGL